MTAEETIELQGEVVWLEQRIRWYEAHKARRTELGPDWEPRMLKCYQARLAEARRLLAEAGNAPA